MKNIMDEINDRLDMAKEKNQCILEDTAIRNLFQNKTWGENRLKEHQ